MTDFLNKARKAIVGAVAAGLAAYLAARDNGVTADEWATVIGAVIVGGVAVYRVPNKPAA